MVYVLGLFCLFLHCSWLVLGLFRLFLACSWVVQVVLGLFWGVPFFSNYGELVVQFRFVKNHTFVLKMEKSTVKGH